jgi:hypothetical protein
MATVAALITPILALGGESAVESGGNGTAIAVISAISIAGGYLLLAGLWYFVFRDRSSADDLPRDPESVAQEPEPTEDPRTAIRRRPGSPFRRR